MRLDPIDAFYKVLEKLHRGIRTNTIVGQRLLTVELAIIALMAFFVAAFLLHDVLFFILSFFKDQSEPYHAFQVLVGGMILTTLSLIAIFITERS